jgi:hypothetical protein
MSSLRQHFQHIKEIVDWTWTLAIMCLVGYISLGQLAQLYWAMVFFGGLAASFGLFYDFSCEQLAALNYLDDSYQIQKAIAASAVAQDLLWKFHNRNPEIANRFPQFIQIKNQVSQIRTTSANKFKQQVNRQTQTPPKNSYQPPKTQPSPTRREPQNPQNNSFNTSASKPVQPTSSRPTRPNQPQPCLKKTNKKRITLEEYREISNKSDYVYVKSYWRNGHPVSGHYRRRPKR